MGVGGQLLEIDPLELQFPFELRKQISCSLQFVNRSDDYIAFKVKTTSPKKYCVRPNLGIVLPRSVSNIVVTMQAQREAPLDMQCKDKFLVQSAVANTGATLKDITNNMFNKESGNKVDEVKLRVVYVAPRRPPSPVREEEFEEGSSPRASESQAWSVTTREFTTARREFKDQEEVSSTPISLIRKLTEEKNSAVQQTQKLKHELELMQREVSKQQSGFSVKFVLLVALLGIILGYFLET